MNTKGVSDSSSDSSICDISTTNTLLPIPIWFDANPIPSNSYIVSNKSWIKESIFEKSVISEETFLKTG